MNIEVLVRWTELKAVPQQNTNDDYLKRLTDPNYEPEQEQVQAQVVYDYSPMVMDLDDVKRFNRSNDPNFTTLRMNDGVSYVIKFPYLDFMQMYIEYTGKTVMSCLPADFENGHDEGTEEGDEDFGSEDDLIL